MMILEECNKEIITEFKNCDKVYYLKKDSLIIGIAALKFNDENILYLQIKERYRGSGYGKEAFKLLLDELKKLNKKEIKIMINKYNIAMKKIIANFNGLKLSEDENQEKYIIILK